MSVSLLDTIRRMITPSVVSRLSGAYGESPAGLQKGLAAAIPTVLAALAARSDDRGFMNQLFAFIKEPAVSSAFDAPQMTLEQAQIAASDPGGLLDRFQSFLFGNTSTAAGAIASYAGLKPSTSSSLLGLCGSLVLGQLGRLVRQDQLDPAGLARRLAGERSSITAALPPALASLAGLGAPSVAGRIPRDVGRVDEQRVPVVPPGRPRRSLGWIAAALVGAVALVALFALLRGNRPSGSARVGSADVPAAVGTSGLVTRSLPGRGDVRFPASGMEGRLLSYIESASPTDRETWFEFDRLNFETDSATLRPDSREQLSNVAEILRAYPRVRVRIGGYTDNSGDSAANQRLSEARARAVAAELSSRGVASDRLEAQGYGDQHPVADNSTADGRARNRRVALRVTDK